MPADIQREVDEKVGGRVRDNTIALESKGGQKINESKLVQPAFKMVLTAVGGFAYRRDDGVIVCPISSLRP